MSGSARSHMNHQLMSASSSASVQVLMSVIRITTATGLEDTILAGASQSGGGLCACKQVTPTPQPQCH